MNRNHPLALACIVGTATFLYQMGHILSEIQSWEIMWNPPTVGQMLIAGAGALVAVGSALGLNVHKLLGTSGETT